MMLTHALKEWNIAIKALEAGDTILLLRKGGIKEIGGQFQVQYRQILLYPTYEHQKQHLLKPSYQPQVTPVPSGWHPETVSISSWANITDIVCLTEEDALNQLLPYHIWNEQFAHERFNWKPRQPLYVLLLRVYCFPEVILIPYSPNYSGCKSWIDLNQPISLEKSISVFSDQDYQKQVKNIHSLVK